MRNSIIYGLSYSRADGASTAHAMCSYDNSLAESSCYSAPVGQWPSSTQRPQRGFGRQTSLA